MGTRERAEMNENIKIENIKNWNEDTELGSLICLTRLIMINIKLVKVSRREFTDAGASRHY